MATHSVSVTIPQKLVLAKDVEFEVKSDSKLLGVMLVSKGNIEWRPAKNSANKHSLTWEKFAELVEDKGRKTRIKR